MSRRLSSVALGLFGLLIAAGASRAEEKAQAPHGSEIDWHEDYTQATQEAVAQRKLLFLFFYEEGRNSACQAFQSRSLSSAALAPFSPRYVWAKAPTRASILVDGQNVRLLSHPAFAPMRGHSGIAIVDYQSADPSLYGRVVSAFPFRPGRSYSPRDLAIILDLPAGTLTQRTMIYVVRAHPEGPASALGPMSRTLAGEAQRHSRHQASVQVQGHHNWDSRFHQINSRLPGFTAQEVVAESWPNEDLVEACVDCVDCWRQSPGHWSAVRGRHRMFGFDIKRGRNGIWYATGIFAR